MDQKQELIARVNKLSKELPTLDLKIQTFTEVIAHLRARVLKAERRKREIHFEINDIKELVRALEQETAQPMTDTDNKNINN